MQADGGCAVPPNGGGVVLVCGTMYRFFVVFDFPESPVDEWESIASSPRPLALFRALLREIGNIASSEPQSTVEEDTPERRIEATWYGDEEVGLKVTERGLPKAIPFPKVSTTMETQGLPGTIVKWNSERRYLEGRGCVERDDDITCEFETRADYERFLEIWRKTMGGEPVLLPGDAESRALVGDAGLEGTHRSAHGEPRRRQRLGLPRLGAGKRMLVVGGGLCLLRGLVAAAARNSWSLREAGAIAVATLIAWVGLIGLDYALSHAGRWRWAVAIAATMFIVFLVVSSAPAAFGIGFVLLRLAWPAGKGTR